MKQKNPEIDSLTYSQPSFDKVQSQFNEESIIFPANGAKTFQRTYAERKKITLTHTSHLIQKSTQSGSYTWM